MKQKRQIAQKMFAPLIFLIVFSFGLIWAAIVPANNEAPDEASHVNMVYFLKEKKKIPVFNRDKGIEPTLYDSRIPSGTYYSMAYNSPLSYLPFVTLATSPAESVSKNNVLPMRAISALFIASFGLFLFLALNNFKPKNPTLSLTIALFAALIPQVIFSAGYINIEPIALFTSAVSFYFLTRLIVAEDKKIGNFVGLGIFLGLLGLCKVNYLIFVLFCFLVLLINIIRSNKRKWLTIHGLMSAVIFSIINLWWWIRNIALYGDPLISGYVRREIIDKAPSWISIPAKQGYNIFTIFERKDFLIFAFPGFFANLGGASIFLPVIFYIIFFLIIIASLYFGLRNIRQNKYSEFIWSTIFVALAAIIYFANKNLYDFSPQGRHLFPLLIPLAILLYFGLSKLKPLWQKIAKFSLVIFAVTASIWGLWLIIDQYYVRGIAYSNLSNSEKVLAEFSWRPINLSKYNDLLNYIVKDNPIYFQNYILVSAAAIFVISLVLIIILLLKGPASFDKFD